MRKFAAANPSLRSARQIPSTLCSRPLCWYRGSKRSWRIPKTIEVLELRVGYVKDHFGKLCRQDIKRPDVLAFMRSNEAEGKLETRDRVRSLGEKICNYADVEGDAYPSCDRCSSAEY
jgi:hypothetical protein